MEQRLNDPLLTGFDDFIARSIARPGISRHAEVAGARIHYLEWPGPSGAAPLLLLHGYLAHAHWWDFVAPWLAERHRVIAPDFSGMGDSARRPRYSYADFHDEITGIVEATGIAGCTAIGHSFGGRALLHACARHPGLVGRAIIVDSRLITPDDPMRDFGEWRPKKRYPNEADILSRFVLRPEEPCPPAALAHMARASATRDGDAWLWKFDEQITRMFAAGVVPGAVDDATALRNLPIPVDLVYGELSRVVDARRAAYLTDAVPHGRAPLVLPCGYHHLPVSQPQPLLATLRALLLPPHRST